MDQTKPTRTPWGNFPPVIASHIQSNRSPNEFLILQKGYWGAKTGNRRAADDLVKRFITPAALEKISQHVDADTMLVPVTLGEHTGVNRLPSAAASYLQKALGCLVDENILQAKILHRVDMDDMERLARQPTFEGAVIPGQKYFLVDDVLSKGATLANLKGYMESNGGQVTGAFVLLAREYETALQPEPKQINAILRKHGSEFRDFWKKEIGYDLEQLTEPETRIIWRENRRLLPEMERLVAATQRETQERTGQEGRRAGSNVLYPNPGGKSPGNLGKSKVPGSDGKRVRKVGDVRGPAYRSRPGDSKGKYGKKPGVGGPETDSVKLLPDPKTGNPRQVKVVHKRKKRKIKPPDPTDRER